jgi:uncharacterized NAD(P)/FAD-binding protein YdhS
VQALAKPSNLIGDMIMKTIGIILAVLGGGSVATSFLRQFAERVEIAGGTSVKTVKVFDPTRQPGAGYAYQHDSASNLLNTRAAGMSALQSNANHFYEWALSNENRWKVKFPKVNMTPDAFVPRALFGLYLNEVYDESVSLLSKYGVIVQHIEASATCLRMQNGRYEISTEHGRKYVADFSVLAIGNQEGMQFDYLKSNTGYFATPYPCTKITQAIESGRSVGILGSSLSAIDAAVSLMDAGHRGKILMISRNGRLPSVRGEHNITRKPTLLSRTGVMDLVRARGGQLRLMEVAEFLRQEIESQDGTAIDLDMLLRANQGPHRYLDAEIEDASVHDRIWQAVVYGLNDSIDLIWHYLPDEDRAIFERDFKSQWLSYRVSFPLDNALKIQKILHSNQLSVYGGCSDVSFNDALGQFAINVMDSTSSFTASLYTDYLINATGYTSTVSQSRSPLLRNMVSSGQARCHKFGGIDVDFDTSLVLTKSGKQHDGLFALGSMVSGTYFWTNAMNVNCRLADGVAKEIIDRAEHLHHGYQNIREKLSALETMGIATEVA